jgi:pimeloyl-ACP methyl ester carboxylesterase
MTERFTSAAHSLETIFDARSCHGTNTAVIDRFMEMRSQGAAFVAAIRVNAGVLVGRVLNRITRRQPQPLRDPYYESRLTEMETRWWHLAASCADLRRAAVTRQSDRAMVFVHGTLSCALQSLKDLFATTPQKELVFRFEHDTFARIGDNGRELATLIRDKLPVKRLVLVAHSRGGLVARVATALLQREHFGGEVRLLTFGTPHAGTPLVRVSSGLLNLLLKLGSPIVDGVPLMTPLLAAFFNVYNVSSLPDGISVMHESSEVLQLLNSGAASDHVECWGSEFDQASTESGFGIDTENVLTGVMGRIAHDLVVPTASALAWGAKQAPLTCSHDRYFEREEVRAAVMAALQPPAAPPPSVAAPVSDRSSRGATDGIPVLTPFRLVRRLMFSSRLPRWFSVPPGFTREQLEVTLETAPPGRPVTMRLKARESSSVLQSMLCEVYEDPPTPDGKTRQLLRAATGELEAIQYGPRWMTFRMVEPLPLPASFDPNAPFGGTKGGTS